jgi:hypothetical protein
LASAVSALRDLMSLSAEELVALDMAVETMKRAGLSVEAGDLLNLRDEDCQTSRSATHTGEAGLGGLAAGCTQSLDLPCRF